MTTRRGQVLAYLQEAAGGWVNGTELANEYCGGSEGLKRLRELRAEGWAIEERPHPSPHRTIWQYRLDPMAPKPGERRRVTPDAMIDDGGVVPETEARGLWGDR